MFKVHWLMFCSLLLVVVEIIRIPPLSAKPNQPLKYVLARIQRWNSFFSLADNSPLSKQTHDIHLIWSLSFETQASKILIFGWFLKIVFFCFRPRTFFFGQKRQSYRYRNENLLMFHYSFNKKRKLQIQKQ